MTRRRPTATVAIVGAVLFALFAEVRAEPGAAGAVPSTSPAFERYHYSIAARIRPLLVFWLSRSGVGDAVVTRHRAPGDIRYSLLIGSDPERAPRRINRWGYIEEEIHGADARLIGLMTQSDEETVAQAEATLNQQAAGRHPFKIIQAAVTGERASSRVTSIAAPEDYTFRQVETVLGLAQRESSGGRSRVLPLPPGTRPGFLAALADAMQGSSSRSITYVYDGRLYELKQTRRQQISECRIAHVSYGRATAADFLITSLHDGVQTPFSMTYGEDGRFAQVPLMVRYQPRWWMQVELTIEDGDGDPTPADGAVR